MHKHGVSFELASTVFADPGLLTVADLGHSGIDERWFSIGTASDGRILFVVYLWSESEPLSRKFVLSPVAEPIEDDGMPSDVDFTKGVRGLHHIPSDARVLFPASIERSVWQYFSKKAEQKGVERPIS